MTLSTINFDDLKEVEELTAILKLYNKAKAFLEAHKWCINVIKGWYEPDFFIYEKIGVFLFEIEPTDETVDKFIWIIIGDLPTVYLDEGVKTSREALELYCELMSEWADNIVEGSALDGCYLVDAKPTIENAELLKRRIVFIKKELL